MFEMKTCKICNIEKSASDFYKVKKNSDGLNTYCKKCDNAKRAESIKKKRRELSLSQPNLKVKPKLTKKLAAQREPLPQKTTPVRTKSNQLDQNFLTEVLKLNKKYREDIKKRQRKSLLKIKHVVSAEFLRISKSCVGDKASVSAMAVINKTPIKYVSEYIESNQADDLIFSMNSTPKVVAEMLIKNGALL